MSDAAGTWWLDEAARAWSLDGARGERRRARAGAAAGRRVATRSGRLRRQSPTRSACRGDRGRGGRRRRGGRRGRARRDRGRATRSFRWAPRRSSSSLPTPIAPRRKNSSTASRTRCPAAGIAWRRCSTAPARSPSPRASSAREVAELEREAADGLSRPRRAAVPALSLRRAHAARRPARARRRLRPDRGRSRVDLTRAVMEGVALHARRRARLSRRGRRRDRPRRPDRRRREQRSVDADDRGGGRSRDHALSRRRDRPRVRRRAAGAARGDRRGAGDVCQPPPIARRRPRPSPRSPTPSPPRASASCALSRRCRPEFAAAAKDQLAANSS